MSESDPIASLHKMSPTAGAASQEYVAINAVAVASVILGLLSLFALMVKVLLILPLAGVALALLAIRQIRRSAGTQTGVAVAGFGLVLSLVISSITLGRARLEYSQEQQDGRDINAVLEKFGQDLAAAFPPDGKPDNVALADAYQQFTDNFQNTFTVEAFTARLAMFTKRFGPIYSINWNGICHFAGESGDDHSAAETLAVFTFTHLETAPDGSKVRSQGRFAAVCRNIPGKGWRIDSLPDLFIAPKAAPTN